MVNPIFPIAVLYGTYRLYFANHVCDYLHDQAKACPETAYGRSFPKSCADKNEKYKACYYKNLKDESDKYFGMLGAGVFFELVGWGDLESNKKKK